MGEVHAATADLGYLSAVEIAERYRSGSLRASEVVEGFQARVDAIDRSGPELRSVLFVDPELDGKAAAAEERRQRGAERSPLEGIPVLVKDNIDTHDLPTTAGSRALLDDRPARDADVVRRLRGAGAIVLGKANLSEWANFRGHPSISGWSAVGGQCRNPHDLRRTPLGSSAGSAAAVAAGLAPLALGSETNGSIIGPCHVCGVVGLKPTVGVLPRTGIVPIAQSFDTAGPIGRTVADVSLLFHALTGTRPVPLPDPVLAPFGVDAEDGTAPIIAGVLDALVADGLRVTDPVVLDTAEHNESGDNVLTMLCEFRDLIDEYLATRPGAAAHTLVELVEFNAADDVELSVFGQELFELALSTDGFDDPRYPGALAACRRSCGTEGIDAILCAAGADVLIAPAGSPAWGVDESSAKGWRANWGAAAEAGYPSLTVSMGKVDGLPVGCLLIGRPLSEATLLAVGERVERALSLDLRPAWTS